MGVLTGVLPAPELDAQRCGQADANSLPAERLHDGLGRGRFCQAVDVRVPEQALRVGLGLPGEAR
jgi:hypothetical protein